MGYNQKVEICKEAGYDAAFARITQILGNLKNEIPELVYIANQFPI